MNVMGGNKEVRAIVCGGRDYADRDRLFAEMDRIKAETGLAIVIHGNARGADTLADQWAKSHGLRSWSISAQWSKYGAAAGPKRNQRMLGMSPDLVIAFPGGKGTRDMTSRARRAGVAVVEVTA